MISKLRIQTAVIFSAIILIFLATIVQCQGSISTLMIDGPGGYLPDDIGIQVDGPNGAQAQFHSENNFGDVVITRKITIYGIPLQAECQGDGPEDTLPEASQPEASQPKASMPKAALPEAYDLLDEGFKKALILKDAHPSDVGQFMVELYNPRSPAVQLEGWSLVDCQGETIALLSEGLLPPEGSLSVAVHGLDGEGDLIRLKDPSGDDVDSLIYVPG